MFSFSLIFAEKHVVPREVVPSLSNYDSKFLEHTKFQILIL